MGGTRIAPDQPNEVLWWVRAEKLFEYGIPEVLVVGLGTNDCLARSRGLDGAIDKLMGAARAVDHVYWVNSPSLLCPQLAAALERAERRHDDLTVLDAVAHFAPERDEWISGDGIHLTERGITEMARFVARAVEQAER